MFAICQTFIQQLWMNEWMNEWHVSTAWVPSITSLTLNPYWLSSFPETVQFNVAGSCRWSSVVEVEQSVWYVYFVRPKYSFCTWTNFNINTWHAGPLWHSLDRSRFKQEKKTLLKWSLLPRVNAFQVSVVHEARQNDLVDLHYTLEVSTWHLHTLLYNAAVQLSI